MISAKWVFFIFLVHATVYFEAAGKELIVQNNTKEDIFQDYDNGKALGNF